MNELKAYRVKGVTLGDTHDVYIKEEADKVIAELKEQISKERSAKVDYKISANDLSYGLAKAYAENQRLKRALYKACANWAWAELVRYVDISDGSQGYKQAQGRWEKMASKCLKKAEECK